MKIVNRILCILVFIAAAATAVFAFLLFQKREQMLKGWGMMSSAIQKTAVALDANSGTKLAADLTPGKLNHMQSLDSLQKNLDKLVAGSKAVVQQRDNLADTLVAAVAKVEVTTENPKALKDLAQTSAKQQAILRSTQQIRERNDKFLASYIATGSNVGVKGQSVSGIKKGGVAAAYEQKIKNELALKEARIRTCQDELAAIGSQVNVRFDRNQYASSAAKIRSAVIKQRQSFSKLESERNAAQRQLKSAESRLKKVNLENAAYKVKVQTLNTEMARRERKYNPNKNQIIDDYIHDRTPLRTLYSKIRGKVLKVEEKWGIVIINIGREYNVRRPVEDKVLEDVVSFIKGRNMTVVRNASSKSPKAIGKIQISNVFDSYSVGNVLAEWQKDSIHEGDDVFFTDEDLDGFLPKDKKSTK